MTRKVFGKDKPRKYVDVDRLNTSAYHCFRGKDVLDFRLLHRGDPDETEFLFVTIYKSNKALCTTGGVSVAGIVREQWPADGYTYYSRHTETALDALVHGFIRVITRSKNLDALRFEKQLHALLLFRWYELLRPMELRAHVRHGRDITGAYDSYLCAPLPDFFVDRDALLNDSRALLYG